MYSLGRPSGYKDGMGWEKGFQEISQLYVSRLCVSDKSTMLNEWAYDKSTRAHLYQDSPADVIHANGGPPFLYVVAEFARLKPVGAAARFAVGDDAGCGRDREQSQEPLFGPDAGLRYHLNDGITIISFEGIDYASCLQKDAQSSYWGPL